MDRRLLVLSLASVTLLSGCNFINQFIRPSEEPVVQEQTESSSSRATDPGRAQQEREIKQQFGDEGGAYRDYQDGDIGNGKDQILFFHASWCPDCQRHDTALKDWYSANYIPLSVLKIDYDSAVGLKQRYGVVQQDTFVRINGQGEAVATKSFPSEIDILQMLRP